MVGNTSIQTLIGLIRSARIDLSTEKRAQADVEQILTQAGIEFEREVPLTESDIVDFMVGGHRNRTETARGPEEGGLPAALSLRPPSPRG